MHAIEQIYLGVVAVMSVVTFVFYGWDKSQARENRPRVPESRLHWLALLGGWPGAIAGRAFFRHKTSKLGFSLLTFVIVGLHLVLVFGWFWQRSQFVD